MIKKHKKIRNGAILLTMGIVTCLIVYGRQVGKLKSEIDEQIAQQQREINEKNRQLSYLEEQYEQMDSDEYIRKIATEELGMVDQDTIVFQIKN